MIATPAGPVEQYGGDGELYALDEPYQDANYVVVTRLCTPCRCFTNGVEHTLRALLVLTDEYGNMLDQSHGFLPHWQSPNAASHTDALAAIGYTLNETSGNDLGAHPATS